MPHYASSGSGFSTAAAARSFSITAAGACAGTGTPGCITGWDNTAPYWQGGTTDRLYLKSYPATSSNWSQSNCGCDGTGH